MGSRTLSFRPISLLAFRRPVLAVLSFPATLAMAPVAGSAQGYPFEDPSLPVEARIDDLLRRMTLEEKIAALGTDPSVPRLGVEGSGHVEGLHGVAQGGPSNWGRRNPAPTTQFPQAVGLGMTWDAELVRRVAEVESYEARYLFQSDYDRAGLVVRAPNADLARDPRWGRTEESYGEDPYLVGELTVAFVRGLQGDDADYLRTASLMKHFLANSNEDERTFGSSDFDERLLHEYYAVPFRRGIVEGGAQAFMTAYNAVNGIPMQVHPMLEAVVREGWGYDGIICTDGGGLRLLVSDHRWVPDLPWGAAVTLKAGVNQFLDDHAAATRQAVEDGLLTEAEIDAALRPTYRVMIRLGQLDPPERVAYRRIGTDGEPEPWERAAHRELARRVAQRSAVLLKNDAGLLPLDTDRLESIAVIGPRADQVLLDWYSGDTLYAVTPLEGIRERAGEDVSVRHLGGWNSLGGRAGGEGSGAAPGGDGAGGAEADGDGPGAAGADAAGAPGALVDSAAVAELAASSDVAVVVVGNHPTCGDDVGWAECPVASWGREAVDRRSLTLEEERLIKVVRRANPNTVVVLLSSFPYAITWTEENVPAIVHMAQAGQELGRALADVLFGDVNPGGRLVHTWARSLDPLPPRLDYDIRHGHTYLYFEGDPLYPFGHGLSYTSFAYSDLRLEGGAALAEEDPRVATTGGADAVAVVAPGAPVTVAVDVTNTGDRAGDEVVQLYVRHLDSSVERPLKELKGFDRVTLEPGEIGTVELTLRAEELAYWDADRDEWVVESAPVELLVGSSSADIRGVRRVEVRSRAR